MRISDWSSDVCSSDLNNPAVSNFCVMDARLLGGVLSNVAGRVISGVFHDDGSIFNDVLNNFVGSVGGFGRLLTASGEGHQTGCSENNSKFVDRKSTRLNSSH